MTREEANRIYVRKAALFSTSLHIAKHFTVDAAIREELGSMGRRITKRIGPELGLSDEVLDTIFQSLQDDEPFRHFIAEGTDCAHLNTIFMAAEMAALLDVIASIDEDEVDAVIIEHTKDGRVFIVPPTNDPPLH